MSEAGNVVGSVDDSVVSGSGEEEDGSGVKEELVLVGGGDEDEELEDVSLVVELVGAEEDDNDVDVDVDVNVEDDNVGEDEDEDEVGVLAVLEPVGVLDISEEDADDRSEVELAAVGTDEELNPDVNTRVGDKGPADLQSDRRRN